MKMLKYPRTTHIEGSNLQVGDEDLSQVPWASLKDRHLVIEEKVDGANSAVSFDENEQLLLQSRGHYLTGGGREHHFALMKTWANCHKPSLRDVLADRYVMYGEWVYAKHTIFYDLLPHYFLEFDVFDRETGVFLSTPKRRELLKNTPVVSVPVVWQGKGGDIPGPGKLVGRSLYKSANWLKTLDKTASDLGLDLVQVRNQTDPSDEMEGLYIKVEEDGKTVGRHKWVRRSFLDTVQQSDGHWLNRPIVPNQLADGVDLYA